MSDSLRPLEPQHARPPCPSPMPGVHPNPCPLSRWRHPAISSSVIPFSSCPQSFPASGSFPMSQLFYIRWPTYWSFSFSISPSNEHPGVISFRMDWLDLLAVQETLKSSPTPQFISIDSLVLSLLYSYVFLVVLCVPCCPGFPVVAASWGYSLVVVCRLIVVTCLVEHRL